MKKRLTSILKLTTLFMALMLVATFSYAVKMDADALSEKKTVAEQASTSVPDGKAIYELNCANCHELWERNIGPAMVGVENRGPWKNRKNLFAFVRNPLGTFKQWAYTKAMVKEYNDQLMPAYPQLTDADMKAVFDYLKTATKKKSKRK